MVPAAPVLLAVEPVRDEVPEVPVVPRDDPVPIVVGRLLPLPNPPLPPVDVPFWAQELLAQHAKTSSEKYTEASRTFIRAILRTTPAKDGKAGISPWRTKSHQTIRETLYFIVLAQLFGKSVTIETAGWIAGSSKIADLIVTFRRVSCEAFPDLAVVGVPKNLSESGKTSVFPDISATETTFHPAVDFEDGYTFEAL